MEASRLDVRFSPESGHELSVDVRFMPIRDIRAAVKTAHLEELAYIVPLHNLMELSACDPFSLRSGLGAKGT
jgi:hypothetical protein